MAYDPIVSAAFAAAGLNAQGDRSTSYGSSYGNGAGSTGGGSVSLTPAVSNINTSGLSGYALAYANALKAGNTDTQANSIATYTTGNAGNGGVGTNFTAFDVGGGRNGNGTTNYNIDGLGSYSAAGNIRKPSLTPEIVQPSLVSMAQMQPLQAPAYTPYQYQEYQQKNPGYSVTANPNETSFVPTARALERWNALQQNNAENAYKDYTTQYNNYAQAINQQQNAVAAALEQAKFDQQTTYQNALIANAQDEEKRQAEQAAAQLALDQKKYDLSASKTGSSGNTKGALTEWQKYQIEQDQKPKTSVATTGFLARVLKFKNASYAKEFIRANAITAGNDGVDLSYIEDQAKKHYGDKWNE